MCMVSKCTFGECTRVSKHVVNECPTHLHVHVCCARMGARGMGACRERAGVRCGCFVNQLSQVGIFPQSALIFLASESCMETGGRGGMCIEFCVCMRVRACACMSTRVFGMLACCAVKTENRLCGVCAATSIHTALAEHCYDSR